MSFTTEVIPVIAKIHRYF